MRVKMKTLMAGPDGTRYPDKVYQVSAKEVKESSAPRAAARTPGRTATKAEAAPVTGDTDNAASDDDGDDDTQEPQA